VSVRAHPRPGHAAPGWPTLALSAASMSSRLSFAENGTSPATQAFRRPVLRHRRLPTGRRTRETTVSTLLPIRIGFLRVISGPVHERLRNSG
jgi:hypothetical protein